MDNLQIASPEIFLLSATCVVLVIGLFLKPEQRHLNYWMAQVTLVVTLIFASSQIGDSATIAFSGAYGVDTMSASLKCWILAIVFGGFLYSRDYLSERQIQRSEYYSLGLFGTAGMMIMVSATNMLTIYLGLELLALSLYAMVALYRSNSSASEAAMKYFVLGALASGMLLYGISMIYGATGTLNLAAVNDALAAGTERSVGARFGLVFVIVGLAFKLGAVPFHMWVPDVYDGAPTCVTLFISTAPKIAAFAMTIRLLVDALPVLHTDWQQMLSILAALSMIVGNLVAIAQTNIKRMLAYSTISHVGFLLMGIVGASSIGYSAAMFYAIVYAFTTLAAFGVLLALSRDGYEAVELSDLSGLFKRNWLLGLVMMLAMFSLAGVPVGVAMSVIGAFYYLRIVKLMFFDEPVFQTEVPTSSDVKAGLAVNGLALVVLGIMPGMIMGVCLAAFS